MKIDGKAYPIDTSGIKNVGIENWLKDYYVPVTGKEFRTIYRNNLNSYVSVLGEQKNEIIYWLAAANIKIPYYVSDVILWDLMLCRLKNKGYTLIISDKKKSIQDCAERCYPVFSANPFDCNVFKKGNNRIKKILSFVKNNVFCSDVINKIYRNISNPTFIIGAKHKRVSSYCDTNNISPIYLPAYLFIKNSLTYNNRHLHNLIHKFIHTFVLKVQYHYPGLDTSRLKLLIDDINIYFKSCLDLFHSNLSIFSKFKPGTLLATNMGNIVDRLFASAWRYSGGEVIGFDHGNQICNCYKPELITADGFLIANKFAACSSGQKDILEKTSVDFSFGLKTSEIILSNEDSYYKMFLEMQKDKHVSEVRKVMIIGFPLSAAYYSYIPEGHLYSHLQLELRLVKLLKKAGYCVIYKVHPDRKKEALGIFEGYVDKIEFNRFEEVYKDADCLLFGHTDTTTFGFSLLTNKPIVFIEEEGKMWFPGVLDLLKKRCRVVEAKADDFGQIIFDDQDIAGAIKKSTNINYDVLYKFAFQAK